MLIDCPVCQAKVHGKLIAEREYPPDENNEPHKYVFLECPSCKSVLLGYSEWGYDEEWWTNPMRLWPDPHKYFDRSIPALVSNSLDDARKCFQAKVYTACAVMCGRAIEAICVDRR